VRRPFPPGRRSDLAKSGGSLIRGTQLLDVVADVPGRPGGETVTQAREAQVDPAAGKHLWLEVLIGLGSGDAEQQLTHPFLPDPSLRSAGQQLGRGQPVCLVGAETVLVAYSSGALTVGESTGLPHVYPRGWMM
jgi:hypothetical protein